METEREFIRATIAQYNDFLSSALWNDLVNEIEIWLQEIRTRLESESDLQTIQRLQGNAEACRNFLQLPQRLLDSLER